MAYKGNDLQETGKKTVNVNDDDIGNVEAAGYSPGTSASTTFSELAEDAALLEEIKEEKREEARQLREKARDIEEKYDL